MKKLALAAAALMGSASMALAFNDPCLGANPPAFCTNSNPVPEISALEGTAALAVVAAMVLLVWERRRRAS